MKNRKIIYLLTVFFLLVAGIFAFISRPGFVDGKTDAAEKSVGTIQPDSTTTDKPSLAAIEKSSDVCALYIDGEKSIEELAESSDLIVRAKVYSQYEYNGISTISEVEISDCIKGSPEEKIQILQLNDDHVLTEDNEYILILGKQKRNTYYNKDGNTYYIKGGTQGIFLIEDDKVSVKDSDMDASFADIKSEKASEDAGKSDADILTDYLKGLE